MLTKRRTMDSVPSFEGEKGWNALRVRPQNEFKVSDFCRKQFQVGVKVPTIEVWTRRNGGKIAVTKPLLATYVFVEAGAWRMDNKLLFSHNGVLGFVRNHSSIAVIPNEQVQSIERLSYSKTPVYDLPYSKLTEGERVRVIRGPLEGAIGQFIRISSVHGCLIVSLDLFKRALVTELESDLLEPC